MSMDQPLRKIDKIVVVVINVEIGNNKNLKNILTPCFKPNQLRTTAVCCIVSCKYCLHISKEEFWDIFGCIYYTSIIILLI